MTALPLPPPEVPASTDLALLAPRFCDVVFTLLQGLRAKGLDPVVREAFRSDARQAWLYGFGRDYDDGRGEVTNAETGAKSWHRYGLAVDVVSNAEGDDAPESFWQALRDAAVSLHLTSGADWSMQDKPHVQWWCEGMPVTPSDHAWELLQSQGVGAVWQELHASYSTPTPSIQ